MNVPRRLIGQVVEIQWKDPGANRSMLHSLKKGRQALATWKEYGVVFDVTDGVVIIGHSLGAEAGVDVDKPDEIYSSAVPEDLIEKIVVFKPEATQS